MSQLCTLSPILEISTKRKKLWYAIDPSLQPSTAEWVELSDSALLLDMFTFCSFTFDAFAWTTPPSDFALLLIAAVLSNVTFEFSA